MVRHLAHVERHNSWGHEAKKKPSHGLKTIVDPNSLSFSEQPGPHGGFVTLRKNEGGTFSPPRSRPSTPEHGRIRAHPPPGYRSRSIPRARTPPRSRKRTPPRLRQLEISRKRSTSPIRNTAHKFRDHSPHVRGARINPQKSDDDGRAGLPMFMSPSPVSDAAYYLPSPFVYEDEVPDPPPQTKTDHDNKEMIGVAISPVGSRSTPWKDPTVTQMAPRDNDSVRADSFDLCETTKATTKIASKDQFEDTLPINSTRPFNQLGLPSASSILRNSSKLLSKNQFEGAIQKDSDRHVNQSGLPSPSSLLRRNSSSRRNRVVSPLRFKKRSKSPLRNIRLGFPKSKSDGAKQLNHKEAIKVDPAWAISCADYQSGMTSPETVEIKADTAVEHANPVVQEDSRENEEQKADTLDNDYGFGKAISGAIAFFASFDPEPNEDPGGEKEDKSKTASASSLHHDDAPVPTPLALEPEAESTQGEAADTMAGDTFKDQRGNGHVGNEDIVFHVRLNVESFIGVSATQRHFRRSKNDHSLMQGYVEVFNPSLVAENCSSMVASQPDISTAVGASKHHFFVWPDNVKEKTRNRLYLSLPLYPSQEGSLTGDAFAKPETVHLRIGVKRGGDLIPLGEAFLEIDIDCPNMHERTVELPIHPLKKESKNMIKGLFSKRNINDTLYSLDSIAILRCIVQAQPGLASNSGATFWGDKSPKRKVIEQGVIHELCSHDSSKPWNNQTNRHKDLFLSPTEEKLEGEPSSIVDASPFAENALGEDATEKNRDRVEQVRGLPSPVAQQSEAAERNLDKVERLRSPTSTGAPGPTSISAYWFEREASRNDVEQTRSGHSEADMGHDRDPPENQESQELGGDIESVTDAGCPTLSWTLGSTRITAKVATLTRKNDPGFGPRAPVSDNRSSQSFSKEIYQIPENTELIDPRKKLCPPFCKIPPSTSPTDDVKVTFEELEDRTWQARMRSMVQQPEHHDMTDCTEDGSAALEVEEPPSKLRSARCRNDASPLPTVEDNNFHQAVPMNAKCSETQRDVLDVDAKSYMSHDTKQHGSPDANYVIDNCSPSTKGKSELILTQPQYIMADSFALSEIDSVTAGAVGDEKQSPRRQGRRPDPPVRRKKTRKGKKLVDIALETRNNETKDETALTNEFSWITATTKAVDPNASLISGTSINADAHNQMESRCITPTHLNVTELTVPEHQPSPKIPEKLPTSRNIRKQLSDDEFTAWVEGGPEGPRRRVTFFNCVQVCDDVDDASYHEKDERKQVDTSGPILQSFPSFVTNEGFETILDLKREFDPGYSLIASLSNLSKGLFWPATKNEETDIRAHPSPEIALSSSSSSSGFLDFLPQNISKDPCWSPKRLETGQPRKGAISFLPQKHVSDISSIESIPSPLSADSLREDCSDSKYDEAARKIFRVAKKLGISADSLIDQLEKGEKIERLLSQKIQSRQYNKSRRSGRKYRRSGYV